MSMETVGDAVTGGVIARTIEPRTGVDSSGHTAELYCLNCRAALQGTYCHVCGQKKHVHRTLTAFFHDLVHGVLHLDGKVWRTFPMLVLHPGDLTRRYIDGERARFVSPFALFLFSVFLMFAVLTAVGGPISDQQSRSLQAELSYDANRAQEQLAGLERRRQALAAAGQSTATVDAEIREARADASLIQEISRDGLVSGVTHRAVDYMPPGVFRSALEKYNADPALALYKLQTNAYKFSWLLIPIMVPLLWLLFLWRRQHWVLYDHTVFVTYQLAFQTLLITLFMVLIRMGVAFGPLVLAAWLFIAVQVHRQFRGTYRLGFFSALWRMVAFTLVFNTALAIFALLLIAMGGAG